MAADLSKEEQDVEEIKSTAPMSDERVQQCEECFEESVKHYSDQRARWVKNEELYENKYNPQRKMKGTKIKIAIVLSLVETVVSIISRILPTFDVKSKGIIIEKKVYKNTFFADMMQKRKRQIERISKLKKVFINACRDSLKFGNAIISIFPMKKDVRYKIDESGKRKEDEGFNKNSELTLKTEKVYENNIDARNVDIYSWYPSPGAIGMDFNKGESRYHIFATPKHPDEVKIMYGITVKPEGYFGKDSIFLSLEEDDDESKKDKANSVLIKEFWGIDVDKEKYPDGRFTLWIGKTIIRDESIDLPRIPYFNLASLKKSNSIMGIGIPDLIKELKVSFDEIMSSVADNIHYTGNPIRKIAETLWSRLKGAIPSLPGSSVRVGNQNDFTYEQPPNIPAYVFSYLELILKIIDVVVMVHDVDRGRISGEAKSGIAIAELQEASHGIAQMKIDNEISEVIQDVGDFIIWILQNFDKEVIALREEDETIEEPFALYDPIDKYDINGKRKGEDDFDEGTAQTLKDNKFDVEVVTGARTPLGRVASENMALEKLKQGIYGIVEYANASNEPEKQKLIDSWYKRQEMQNSRIEVEEFWKVREEFFNIIVKILKYNDKIKNGENIETVEEYEKNIGYGKIALMLKQFPKLVNEDIFEMLPFELKDKLLQIFNVPETEGTETE